MDLRDKAIQKIENDKLSTTDIMCAFDIIGIEFLGGDMCYFNNFQSFCDLIVDFELEDNEILEFMLKNKNYSISDCFISFDGETLTSFNNTEYFKEMIIEKMNGECAEFIMGC